MGNKTVAFVQRTSGYATQTLGFADAAEFGSDAAALAGRAPLHQLLDALALDTDSTMLLAGFDAYAAALVVHNNSKFSAKNS